MEAQLWRGVLALSCLFSMGATYSTPNFVVNAPTAEMAKEVAELAEQYRVSLAKEWIGETLPEWNKPCQVRVLPDRPGAGGATTFVIHNGHVFKWNMQLEGPYERILDSVLPHEVSHTIFACHFRRALPRWADEGAATLTEHESEKLRQLKFLKEMMGAGRRYNLRTLFSIKEYPEQQADVLMLYAQGYSVCDFLVQQGGKPRFLQFIQDAHVKDWDYSLQKHYKYASVEALESRWSQWFKSGSPDLKPAEEPVLASNESPESQTFAPARREPVIRSQNPSAPIQTAQLTAEQAPPEQFAPPRTPRGQDLQAPDPRTVGNQQAASAPDGRLPRPEPLWTGPVAPATLPVTTSAREVPEFDLPPRSGEQAPPGDQREWSQFPTQ